MARPIERLLLWSIVSQILLVTAQVHYIMLVPFAASLMWTVVVGLGMAALDDGRLVIRGLCGRVKVLQDDEICGVKVDLQTDPGDVEVGQGATPMGRLLLTLRDGAVFDLANLDVSEPLRDYLIQRGGADEIALAEYVSRRRSQRLLNLSFFIFVFVLNLMVASGLIVSAS